MKSSIRIVSFLVIVALLIVGCGGGGGGPTTPATPPELYENTAVIEPDPANEGATVILKVQFTDISETMNGGIAYITDGQGFSYQGTISNAAGAAGTLTTSFQLSTLVTPGPLLLTIFVQNSKGQSSNTINKTITII